MCGERLIARNTMKLLIQDEYSTIYATDVGGVAHLVERMLCMH